MAKNLNYFMRDTKDEVITVKGPDSFKDDKGNVLDLQIKVLSQAELQKIRKAYTSKKIALDKSGNPYISGGELVYEVDKDSDKIMNHIIAESLVYPNLKDEELMKHYNCFDITQMPLNVFKYSNEYAHIQKAVLSVINASNQTNIEDVESAKN